MKAVPIKNTTKKADAARKRLRRAAKEYRSLLKNDPIERALINEWSEARLSQEE